MAYTVQRIIDCMTQPNSPSGYYPAWGPANYNPGQDPNQQGNQWGSDQAGNPYTGSYAYVSQKIRQSDPTCTGDGYYYTYLDQRGLGDGQAVMPYPWVDVNDSWQHRNTATNARVHYKDMYHYTLLTDGTWVLSGYEPFNSVQPGSYLNFGPAQTNIDISQGSAYNQYRFEAGGGVSLGAINQGATSLSVWEAYPLQGYVRSIGYFKANVVGTLVFIEARTILHNGAGTDDRNLQYAMLKIGCDWTIQGVANLGEYMHSNWQVVSADGVWNLYASTDIPAATLQANPPPGFGASITPPPPLPTLTGLPIYANWVLVGDWQGDEQPTPIVPANPSNLTATVSSSTVTLVWSGSHINTAGYVIERSSDGASYSQLKTIDNGDTWNSIDTPANGTWFYRLYAQNANGVSGYSNVVQVTVDASVVEGPPGNPIAAPVTRLLPGRFRQIQPLSGGGTGWV